MTAHTLASDYLSALERGDLAAILSLFRPGAIVRSPLYGPLPATEFYPRLLAHAPGVRTGDRHLLAARHSLGAPMAVIVLRADESEAFR